MPSEAGPRLGPPGSADESTDRVVRADVLEPYIRDYLSEQGLQTRHSLLLVSTLALLVALTGLVPEKIEFLGIEFTAAQQDWFVWILLAVTVYFLTEFLIEFWRVIASAGIAVPKGDKIPKIPRELFGHPIDLRVLVSWYSHVYVSVKLILPIIVAVCAILLLVILLL